MQHVYKKYRKHFYPSKDKNIEYTNTEQHLLHVDNMHLWWDTRQSHAAHPDKHSLTRQEGRSTTAKHPLLQLRTIRQTDNQRLQPTQALKHQLHTCGFLHGQVPTHRSTEPCQCLSNALEKMREIWKLQNIPCAAAFEKSQGRGGGNTEPQSQKYASTVWA